MHISIPTWITLARIALIPVMILVYYWEFPGHRLVCALLFGLGALSDWLDGYIARRFNLFSAFGEFLDPVADKLAVAVALLLVVEDATRPAWLLTLPAAVIIGREITVSALREWMAEIGQRRKVAVSWAGKLKTTLQMIAIFLLLLSTPPLPLPLYEAGVVMLYAAAIMTLWSMLGYLAAAWPEFTHRPPGGEGG